MNEPATWRSLADGLAAVVRELSAGVVVQLLEAARPDGGCYAQLWQSDDRLTAEVSGAAAAPDRRLPPDAAAHLTALGWAPAGPDGNWTFVLAWPALPAEYQELAARVVGALRDVWAVASAEALAYAAWSVESGEPVELSGLGLDRLEVAYYARVGAGDTARQPKGLLRRTRAGYRVVDEALGRGGDWRDTETLNRAELGELDDTLVRIDEAQAARVAADWRRHARLPAPATDDGPELRWGSAPELRQDGTASAALRQRPRLRGFDRAAVASYLRDAPVALVAMGLGPDVLDPSAAEVVPMNVRTDGTWVWSEALAYFVDRYGIAPEPDFLAHIQRHDYRWPEVDEPTLLRAARLR